MDTSKLALLAPLFIGCDWYRGGTPDEKLIGVLYSPTQIVLQYADGDEHTFEKGNVGHKPVLRRMKDLTAWEKAEYNVIRKYGTDYLNNEELRLQHCMKKDAEATDYLRSIWIDLNGLIEAGLAIDKNEIQ